MRTFLAFAQLGQQLRLRVVTLSSFWLVCVETTCQRANQPEEEEASALPSGASSVLTTASIMYALIISW